ncbi:MAG: (deoxy)nucleoside triphosphate pyrophosphohydrolase [Bacteroidales bacterium]|nr:(deoxy)nucleoside triphosphate pyrophosphohydrolase [Bacteroidales bacterium]
MKTVEVVAAIIVRDGRVFATQRGYGAWKDWWEFPGGKIEPGESPEAALVREIREELSAEIVVDRFLTTVEWDYPEFHLKMHCFLCSLAGSEGGSGLHLNEHEAARWLLVGNPGAAASGAAASGVANPGAAEAADSLTSVRWLPADLSLLPLIQEALE